MSGPPLDRPANDASLAAGDPRAPGPTLASFEQSVVRLTQIVERLEEGDLTLEESLQLFEEGVKLARQSQERLDRAEKRVDKLLRVDEQGRTKTEPFDRRDDDEDGPF
jgi:exodeoxyribonuclease VII small subunit